MAPKSLVPDMGRIGKPMLIYNNVRSLQSNVEWVRADGQLLVADMLVFSESRINDDRHADFALAGFSQAYYNEPPNRFVSFFL